MTCSAQLVKMGFIERLRYLSLKSVKKLSSFRRMISALNNFNDFFGDRIVSDIKPVDLENYQEKREEKGAAYATIDMELSIAKTMVTKAFDNDMVDGRVIKAFRCVKRKMKFGANARRRIVKISEYLNILEFAPAHLKPIIITAYNTGMRMGELLTLRWDYIDRNEMFIRLPAEITKEARTKDIPINQHVKKVLSDVPRALKHDFVFTYQGKPFQEGGIKRSFKTACKNANVPYGRKSPDGITFHDIRRTVKTYMLYAGVNKVHRDLILGHRLQGMDIYYLTPSDKSLRNEMEKYTLWLDEKIADAQQVLTKPLTKIKKELA